MLGRIESPAFTISRNLRRAVLIRTFGGNLHGGLNERVPLGRAGRAGCAGWGDACGCGPPHRTPSPVHRPGLEASRRSEPPGARSAGGRAQGGHRDLRRSGDGQACPRSPLAGEDAGRARGVRPALRRSARADLHQQDRHLPGREVGVHERGRRRRLRHGTGPRGDEAARRHSRGRQDDPPGRSLAHLRHRGGEHQPHRQLSCPVRPDHSLGVLPGPGDPAQDQEGSSCRRPARGARSSTPLRKREDQPWRRPDSATSPSRPS